MPISLQPLSPFPSHKATTTPLPFPCRPPPLTPLPGELGYVPSPSWLPLPSQQWCTNFLSRIRCARAASTSASYVGLLGGADGVEWEEEMGDGLRRERECMRARREKVGGEKKRRGRAEADLGDTWVGWSPLTQNLRYMYRVRIGNFVSQPLVIDGVKEEENDGVCEHKWKIKIK